MWERGRWTADGGRRRTAADGGRSSWVVVGLGRGLGRGSSWAGIYAGAAAACSLQLAGHAGWPAPPALSTAPPAAHGAQTGNAGTQNRLWPGDGRRQRSAASQRLPRPAKRRRPRRLERKEKSSWCDAGLVWSGLVWSGLVWSGSRSQASRSTACMQSFGSATEPCETRATSSGAATVHPRRRRPPRSGCRRRCV